LRLRRSRYSRIFGCATAVEYQTLDIRLSGASCRGNRLKRFGARPDRQGNRLSSNSRCCGSPTGSGFRSKLFTRLVHYRAAKRRHICQKVATLLGRTMFESRFGGDSSELNVEKVGGSLKDPCAALSRVLARTQNPRGLLTFLQHQRQPDETTPTPLDEAYEFDHPHSRIPYPPSLFLARPPWYPKQKSAQPSTC
jgi:hypothetical protein